MTARIILEGITLEEYTEMMRQIIREEIQQHENRKPIHVSVSEIARQLGVTRPTAYRILKNEKLGVKEVNTYHLEKLKERYSKER